MEIKPGMLFEDIELVLGALADYFNEKQMEAELAALVEQIENK